VILLLMPTPCAYQRSGGAVLSQRFVNAREAAFV